MGTEGKHTTMTGIRFVGRGMQLCVRLGAPGAVDVESERCKGRGHTGYVIAGGGYIPFPAEQPEQPPLYRAGFTETT